MSSKRKTETKSKDLLGRRKSHGRWSFGETSSASTRSARCFASPQRLSVCRTLVEFLFFFFFFFSPLALPLFRCVLRLWQPCIIGKTLTFRPPHTPLVPPPEERFPFRGAAFFGRGTSAFASRGGEQPPLTRFSLLFFLCFLSTSLGRG